MRSLALSRVNARSACCEEKSRGSRALHGGFEFSLMRVPYETLFEQLHNASRGADRGLAGIFFFFLARSGRGHCHSLATALIKSEQIVAFNSGSLCGAVVSKPNFTPLQFLTISGRNGCREGVIGRSACLVPLSRDHSLYESVNARKR